MGLTFGQEKVPLLLIYRFSYFFSMCVHVWPNVVSSKLHSYGGLLLVMELILVGAEVLILRLLDNNNTYRSCYRNKCSNNQIQPEKRWLASGPKPRCANPVILMQTGLVGQQGGKCIFGV
ncbi:hypothetical protein CRM22_006766 [Opisthorchis felineus]|uniref:Uncharacterized protein n=1 Tax=Opisthorchis felineus TaxID=147828 RepID=A0A4S2LRS3_OPIFE|nr:hypothetical protein CRM22_006766 [Opisthorchis felineus]